MRKHVYIAPAIMTTAEKQNGFSADVSFWKSLWSKFSKKANRMEIHCWVVEKDVIKQLSEKITSFGNVGEIVVFETLLTEEIIDWLSRNSIDSRSGLKWFSMFLFDSTENLVLSVGHYGGEIIFYPENIQVIEEVKSFFNGEITIDIVE